MASKNKSRTHRAGQSGPRRFPISLVMIVRDEEASLGRCLASVQGLVDEMIVVDTGSSDATVAIAESYGATVSHFTWVDDFSAAKNHALAQATHPWRLLLDADEWIADRNKAAAALEAVRREVPSFVGRIEMLQLDEETGELRDTETFPLPRLLPRQVTFEGRVHEQPRTNLPMLDLPLLLGHDGYTRAANTRKDGRNIALLEAALAENPDNPYYWFQLGTDHYSRQRYEQALPYLVQAYNLLHPANGEPQRWEFRPWWHLLTVKLMLTLHSLQRYEESVALGEQEAETWLESSEFFYVFGASVRAAARRLVTTDKQRADAMLTSAVGCWIHAAGLIDKQDYSGALKARGSVLAAEGLVEVYEMLGRPADAATYRAIAEERRTSRPVPVAASA